MKQRQRTMRYKGKDVYLAKYDIVFKALLLSDGDYSLLASLLSSILSIEVQAEDISVLNVELPPEHGTGRLSRMDIRIRTPENSHINVEIQLTDEKNMDRRSIYHLSRLYTGQMRAKMRFNDLGPAIAINILDFKYLPYEEYHNVYRLKNVRNNEELTSVFEINFIELPKVTPEGSDTLKDLWMRFISAENEEVLDMLAEQSPIMEKAVKKLVYVSADELVRYEMDMREKAELDYWDAMIRNNEEIAKELLIMGMSIEQISKATKLSVHDISLIKDKNNQPAV